MRSQFVGAAVTATLAIGMLTAGTAQASCQSICVRLYYACLASGGTQAQCMAEKNECFQECTGGRGASSKYEDLVLRDSNAGDMTVCPLHDAREIQPEVEVAQVG